MNVITFIISPAREWGSNRGESTERKSLMESMKKRGAM